MKTGFISSLLLVLALSWLAEAQEARFDVQSFRPSAAPQDLVMVGQSRPLAHLSAAGGLFLNFSLDPLVLLRQGSQQKEISIVGNRLQLDAVAVLGLFDWLELGLDLPLVVAQSSDNLQAIGTEGFVRTFAPGD